jgi:hypothetical protein
MLFSVPLLTIAEIKSSTTKSYFEVAPDKGWIKLVEIQV